METKVGISAKRFISLTLLGFSLATILTFSISDKPVLIEIQIALCIIASQLFLLFCFALYSGMVLREDIPTFNNGNQFDFYDLPSLADIPDVGGGILGAILAAIVSLVVFIIVLLAVALMWRMVFVVFVAIYRCIYQALSVVLLNSQYCKGNITRSIAFSLRHTFLYVGWILVVFRIFS